MWLRGPMRWIVALGAGAALAGCAGSAPPAGESVPAEIAPTVDCAVHETRAALGIGGEEDLPAAPRAGAIPAGFEPVVAVECRMSEITVLPMPEATVLPTPQEPRPRATIDPSAPGAEYLETLEPGETLPVDPMVLPGVELPVPPPPDGVQSAPAPAPPRTSIDVVRLEGDLGPLRQQLARPDVPARPDQACMAMFVGVPLLYLVDADHRAVRVDWPRDACGFPLDGARESLTGLSETSRTTITLP